MSLAVAPRKLRDVTETPSGIVRPRAFSASPQDCVDGERLRKTGRLLARHTSGILSVSGVRREITNRTSAHPEQITAKEYDKACRALDLTEAGERATALLFRYLTDPQRESAVEHGYFDLVVHDRAFVDYCLRRGAAVQFSCVWFRIFRGYPNGNVHMALKPGQYRWNLCLHPLTPYPIDDIVLAQYMMLRHAPDDFIQAANVTRLGTSPLRPKRFDRVFAELVMPGPLAIPHRSGRGSEILDCQ